MRTWSPCRAVAKTRASENRFDSFIATTYRADSAGAIRAIRLKIEGLEEGASAISGYEFIKRYNTGDPIPVSGDVVIIGGGFTAVDCARAARRLLGQQYRVTAIMYRRGEEHMSASPDEIWQLRLEGIDVGTLVNPARARCEGGQVKAVVFDQIGRAHV